MIRLTSRPAIRPGVLGRLALGVVEVRRDGDDRLGDLLAEVRLGVGLELLEDHRRDLGRGVALAVGDDLDAVGLGVLLDRVRDEGLRALDLGVVPAAAHEALDRVDGVGRVGDRLALGQLADDALAGLAKPTTDGTVRLPSERRDDGGLAALHHRDDGVRRSEVDADDLAHARRLSWSLLGVGWVGDRWWWMDQLVGPAGASSAVAATATSAGPDDAVAQPVAAPDLVDDLALGAAGARDAHDRLVLARVERRAGRRLDWRHALALEEQAQLAVDGGDAVGPRRRPRASAGRVSMARSKSSASASTLRMRSSPARPSSRSRSSAVRRLKFVNSARSRWRAGRYSSDLG